jgi:GNAT superfamily N-acetyltransferase
MSIRYRRFGCDENEAVARIFARGYNDLLARAGYPACVDVDDPAAWKAAFERDRRAVFEHLGENGSESWLAEDADGAQGYARSIVRDGVRQLTDFWVLPDRQTGGIGQGLLESSFSADPKSRGRIVVSTTAGSAMARYLKAGLDVVCPVLEFEGPCCDAAGQEDIDAIPITDDAQTLDALNRIDRTVLGFEREIDHRFFLADRSGYLYRRGSDLIGYGYVGHWHGPFAALEPAALPAILTHAESLAARRGTGLLLNVPLDNSIATRFLLARGYRMHDRFVMLFLTERLRPYLDRYIFWSPGFC